MQSWREEVILYFDAKQSQSHNTHFKVFFARLKFSADKMKRNFSRVSYLIRHFIKTNSSCISTHKETFPIMLKIKVFNFSFLITLFTPVHLGSEQESKRDKTLTAEVGLLRWSTCPRAYHPNPSEANESAETGSAAQCTFSRGDFAQDGGDGARLVVVPSLIRRSEVDSRFLTRVAARLPWRPARLDNLRAPRQPQPRARVLIAPTAGPECQICILCEIESRWAGYVMRARAGSGWLGADIIPGPLSFSQLNIDSLLFLPISVSGCM